MFIALLIGFGIAYVGALPVAGPVAVLVVERALAGQRRAALGYALGAALPEATYAGGSAMGAAALVARFPSLIPIAHGIGGGVVLVVGALLLRRRVDPAAPPPVRRPAARGPVLTAFLVTALNPTLLITWSAVTTPLVAMGAIRGVPGACVFGLGAGAGAGAGGATLAFVLARHGWRLGERGVQVTRRIAGVALIGLGALLIARALLPT